MDWITYLVLLLIAAGYILNHLAKNQQQNAPPRRPLPPLDPDAEPRPRRATTQLEKFLEDMQRRKEGEDVRTAAPIYEAVEVPDKPGPPPLPRSAEQRRKGATIGSKRSPRRPEPAIVIERQAPLAMPSSVPAAVQPNQALPPPPDAPLAIHRPEALPSRAPQSPAVKMVRALLKNRQSMGAAFLLKEILDRPRSRRPR